MINSSICSEVVWGNDNVMTSSRNESWISLFSKAANGSLSIREVADTAMLLAESGEQLSLSHSFVCDVASTGGPSSLSTLITPLALLSDPSVVVPKLGVPGRPAGGLDVLAQIPGYLTAFQSTEIERLLGSSRYVHFESGGIIAPQDAEVFALRQQLGFQQVPDLVIASILSKKLACGVTHAGLDVRVAGYGNFGTDYDEARKNAKRFVTVAASLGMTCFCAVTDGTFPYQPYIGRGESLVALSNLHCGVSNPWLESHFRECCEIASHLVPQASNFSPEQCRKYFLENVIAQGGSMQGFQDIVHQKHHAHTHVITAPQSGFVQYDLESIRNLIVSRNQSYSSQSKFADVCGVYLVCEPSQPIQVGEPVLTGRLESGDPASFLADLTKSFKIVGEHVSRRNVEIVS